MAGRPIEVDGGLECACQARNTFLNVASVELRKGAPRSPSRLRRFVGSEGLQRLIRTQMESSLCSMGSDGPDPPGTPTSSVRPRESGTIRRASAAPLRPRVITHCHFGDGAQVGCCPRDLSGLWVGLSVEECRKILQESSAASARPVLVRGGAGTPSKAPDATPGRRRQRAGVLGAGVHKPPGSRGVRPPARGTDLARAAHRLAGVLSADPPKDLPVISRESVAIQVHGTER